MERLTIVIRPGPTEEALLRVEDAMLQVLDLIRLHLAAGEAFASPDHAFDWRLEQASTRSPFTVVAVAEPVDPAVDVGKQVATVKLAVRTGLRGLMRGDTPQWMNRDAFIAARDLFARTQNGVTATFIEYGPKDLLTIDRDQAAAALRAINAIAGMALGTEIPDHWAWGEIRGVMVAVGRHAGRPAINLSTDQYGFVWCPLTPEQSEKWGGAHRIDEVWKGHTLAITGRLLYQKNGAKLARIEVADIREVQPTPPIDLDRIADPLFTAGLDPAEYLRQLHEGELA